MTGTRIGALSGVCSGNPYGGKQYTYYRESTGGYMVDAVGNGGCNNGGWCTYNAFLFAWYSVRRHIVQPLS